MPFNVVIQDFTGVYENQPFMKGLSGWIDCTKISGTDCYCDDDAQAEIRQLLGENLPGIHFFDNGNYHYMSKLWTDRIQEPFDLVVIDHHPDMQPPRFEGILSCGGWVKEVLDQNKFVQNVILIGVADHLIDEIRNEPSVEFEKYRDKVCFVAESALREQTFESVANAALSTIQAPSVYISIDKDGLSPQEAVTNWDQGSMTFSQLENILQKIFACKKVLGVDICGERAHNQDYANGMDEGTADVKNNRLNERLFQLLQNLFV